MTYSDLNFWGEIGVPVGLSICFGYALAVWFVQELKEGKAERIASRAKAQPIGDRAPKKHGN